MKQRKNILERIVCAADLGTEPLPRVPLVELAGERRVLIENHHGVRAYGPEEILVSVSYGSVAICGTQLELACMNGEKLIITGNIDSIRLCRGRS